MNKFFRILATSALLSNSALAALAGSDTATVTFQGMGSAVYGRANEPGGTFAGNCTGPDGSTGCFVQNSVVIGVVNDPADSGAHLHRQGLSSDRELEYHVDSTGMYVRMNDLSSFTLQSMDINVTNGFAGGNFKLYGYANPINDGILTDQGGNVFDPSTQTDKLIPSDPEGGNVPFIATYTISNDGSFNQTITINELKAEDPDWENVGAFWLTFENFNHSPTTSYLEGSYPEWNVRVDNIVLGAPPPPCQPTLQITILP